MEEITKDTLLRQPTRTKQGLEIKGGLIPVERELTLADIWLVVWKRAPVVLLFAVIALLLGALYTFTKKPIYESTALIQIDPSQRGSLGLDDVISQKLSSGDFDSRLQTQVRILQSDTVSMQVIKDLDLAHKEAFAGKEIVARVRVSDPVKMSPKDRDAVLRIFRASEIISALPKTQMIGIRFRSTDPVLATQAVNAVLAAYVQRNFESRYQGTKQVSEWLSQQMQDIRSDAVEAQQKLVEFQKQNNILGADDKNNIVTDRLSALNQQLMEAEADRIAKEARYRLASTGNPELVATVVPNSTLQILRTQEAELKAQYAQVNAKYGSGYPKVRELQAQLSQLSTAIAQEVNNVEQRLRDEYLTAGKSEDMLRKRFDSQKQEAFKLNESAVRYDTLKHEVESSQLLFDTLQMKLKEAGVTAGLASADVDVVDRAKVPDLPVLPRKALNLALSFFGGVLGGLILAFVLESLDDTLRTSEEVEAFSSLPALAVVPELQNSRKGPNSGVPQLPGAGLGVMSVRQPNSQFAEACRGACSSLLLSSVGEHPRLLVITSAMPSEGKSVISCNLAISLAQRGGRVLLVDGDLRRSSLHKQFNIETRTGLSSVLSGASESDVIQQPLPEVPNLFILPAGPRPPSPVEMLASEQMRNAMKRWVDEYDFVVIDTAPILPVVDTLPLAAEADAVILVVRAGWSRKKALTRMRDVLQRANANIVGVMVNGIDLKLEYYYSYSSRYGYRYKSNYHKYYKDSDETN